MSRPIIAIVGLPNVGKSTLFNRLAGRRIAIVSDTPGTTRDRVSIDAEWRDRSFIVVDTGGIEDRPAASTAAASCGIAAIMARRRFDMASVVEPDSAKRN